VGARIVQLGNAFPFPAANWRQRDRDVPTWFESTQEHYWDGLEVLPPRYFRGGFFVGEASDGDERGVTVYAGWVMLGDERTGPARYFVREFPEDKVAEALAELREALAAEKTAPVRT
jgi:hypothetical protein